MTQDKQTTGQSMLNTLSAPALAAAMKGGMVSWGQHASATEHVRYAEPIPKEYWPRRRLCRCGCGKRSTHHGKANGITLTYGCEFSMRRWVIETERASG